MSITYTEEKIFTQDDVQNIFLYVGWISGQYPTRLYKALMHYPPLSPLGTMNDLSVWYACLMTAS